MCSKYAAQVVSIYNPVYRLLDIYIYILFLNFVYFLLILFDIPKPRALTGDGVHVNGNETIVIIQCINKQGHL